jgi:branched-chain amino acid transport system ATP-binding protein
VDGKHQVPSDALLAAVGLSSGYGAATVIRDINLHVRPGEIVLLIGPNGAGKTTTLLTLGGEIAARSGHVWFKGNVTKAPLSNRARGGLSFVTEDRCVFMGLTTAENLRLGRGDTDMALSLFPELVKRLKIKAGALSGGEQQMLAVARALCRKPKVLLADELSQGLAPVVVHRLLEALRAASNEGLGVILVEQHLRSALPFADRAYMLRQGNIVHSGTSADISARLGELEQSYFRSDGR